MPNKYNKYTEETLGEAVALSESFAEVVRFVKGGNSGSMHTHLKNRIINYGIDYNHFTHRNTKSDIAHRRSSEEMLQLLPEGSPRIPRRQLLRALMESGMKYRCATQDCISSLKWQDKILNLEIDHINGNSLDNNLDNLRFLCPNCHSQTESNNRSRAFNPYIDEEGNYVPIQNALSNRANKGKKPTHNHCLCGNKKLVKSKQCLSCSRKGFRHEKAKINWPTLQDLIAESRLTSYTAVGKRLKVSEAAVRQRIRTRSLSALSELKNLSHG
jgi:hypothetical protein